MQPIPQIYQAAGNIWLIEISVPKRQNYIKVHGLPMNADGLLSSLTAALQNVKRDSRGLTEGDPWVKITT